MCSYMPRAAPFTEGQLRVAIEKALCGSDVLRHLGYGVKGDNYRTLQRWAQRARHALRRNTPRVRSCAGCGEIFSPRGSASQILLTEVLGQDCGRHLQRRRPS